MQFLHLRKTSPCYCEVPPPQSERTPVTLTTHMTLISHSSWRHLCHSFWSSSFLITMWYFLSYVNIQFPKVIKSWDKWIDLVLALNVKMRTSSFCATNKKSFFSKPYAPLSRSWNEAVTRPEAVRCVSVKGMEMSRQLYLHSIPFSSSHQRWRFLYRFLLAFCIHCWLCKLAS